MNEALQGISTEVQQLLWQMQTEVVIEAIKDLRSARLPPGGYNSLRRCSNLEALPRLENSGPSGKLLRMHMYMHVYVCVCVYVCIQCLYVHT